MWFDERVFYQIYPLGFCGAERENDFGETRHRFNLIEAEIPRLKELGVGAVLFNPLFESERHGYDTVDFFKIDRRLGTNEEFAALVRKLHEAGIRVVLDGVFNHVGRAFPPFREVLEKREVRITASGLISISGEIPAIMMGSTTKIGKDIPNSSNFVLIIRMFSVISWMPYGFGLTPLTSTGFVLTSVIFCRRGSWRCCVGR